MKQPLVLGFADTFGTAINFFTDVLGQRYDITRDDDAPDYLIFGDSNFGETHYRYKNSKKIFYTGENVRPVYFGYDHAMTFDHENSPKHYRLPLYVLEMKQRTYQGWTDDFNYLTNIRPKIDWEKEYDQKTRFCSFVQTNPHNAIRNQFFTYLDERQTVDSGGPHLNNIGRVLPRDDLRHKHEFVRTRKFNIAFENGSHPGYCTEKILEAFYANTIPIYYGSPTVHYDFNPKAFINCHEYKGFEEVWERIRELDDSKNKYLDVLTQPVFENNIPNTYCNLDSLLDWWDTFVYEGSLKGI
jgi:alpha(1,3/1,4) fucosyltransferase